MKFKIRKGIFETNSSSVHTLVICSDENFKYDFPSNMALKLEREEYGWGPDLLETFYEKADYIFEMCFWKDFKDCNIIFTNPDDIWNAEIIGFNENGYVNKYINWLKEKGIEIEIVPGISIYNGYIDHEDSWGNTIKELFEDSLLEKLLFNPDSVIVLSNDNEPDALVDDFINKKPCAYITLEKYN